MVNAHSSRVMANRLLLSYLCICDCEPVSEKNKIVLFCRAVCRHFERGGGGGMGGGANLGYLKRGGGS